MVKNIEISLSEQNKFFSIFKKKGVEKKDFDFKDISELRQLLSNEKARILHAIKYEKPESIYQLSKILNRSFKSVSDDLKILARFDLVKITQEKTKKRVKHKPELLSEEIVITFRV